MSSREERVRQTQKGCQKEMPTSKAEDVQLLAGKFLKFRNMGLSGKISPQNASTLGGTLCVVLQTW